MANLHELIFNRDLCTTCSTFYDKKSKSSLNDSETCENCDKIGKFRRNVYLTKSRKHKSSNFLKSKFIPFLSYLSGGNLQIESFNQKLIQLLCFYNKILKSFTFYNDLIVLSNSAIQNQSKFYQPTC